MAENLLGGVFSTPSYKPSKAQGIARALQGFGAGYDGGGGQFIESIQAQDRALSQERTQAMIQDALAVDNLLANSDVETAMTLMNQRLNYIKQLGGDPTDTAEVMGLVAQGRVPEARQLIGGFLGQAESMGLYQRPKPEAFTLGADEVRFEGGKEVARGIQKPVQEERARTAKDVNGVERFIDGPNAGKPVFPGVTERAVETPELPAEIVAGMSPDQAAQARAVFSTVGGGAAGINAVAQMGERSMAAEEVAETRRKARAMQLSAISLAASILANPETKDVVGAMQGRGVNNMLDPQNTQAIADIEELANKLTAENLDLMSGVLSETDMKVIASVAGGGLDRRRDDKQFIDRVEKILFELARAQDFTVDELAQMSDDQLAQYERVLRGGSM